ncbi:hypothetical protein SO802_025112 [Lithocarpus litseifolius]|uniref:SKP1-like protein n=1 Tax=Lithocarpus litseifolius TaxID=425828 RepID=A0AAW2BXR2_9ROSI
MEEQTIVSNSTSQPSDVILPKSKGADYCHLIAEAQSQSQSNLYMDSIPSLADVMPGEFNQGLGPMLSVRGEGVLSWIGNDNFVEEDKTTATHEVALWLNTKAALFMFRILAGCSFSGDIPNELGNIAELSFLRLDRNALTGNVPSNLNNLTNINELWVAPYCASKWAIKGLTRSVAKELPDGMAVIALNPGVIKTDMLESCFGDSAGLYQEPEAWFGEQNSVVSSIGTMSSSKKITLKSSDGEAFEVEEAVALESQTIKHMIEDDCADHGIPLPNVTSKILAKVIEYCKKHVESTCADERTSDEDLKAWDTEFVRVDQATLFDLILAANYLNIKCLLDLTCQTVADMIKGKTPEEIRKTFNIKNDFTPEEEEEVRRENQWAFE